MRLPGLNVCEFATQLIKWSRVFEIVAAAIVLRLPTCVRFGPKFEPAVVPPIAWHMTHVDDRNTCWPRFCESVDGGTEPCVAFCRHAMNWSGGSATIHSAMRACCRPQYSAHWPR